jgi:CubicO group peptidase (beta-lactamase class C family)
MSLLVRSALLLLLASGTAGAAPDEQKLGKDAGYPVGKASTWYYNESVRVGSFSHQADISGLFRGGQHTLARASTPMPLPHAEQEPAYRWDIGQEKGLTVDDFLARQRIMGLIVVKDGVIQVERYQYDRKPTDRFTSQSMAKSITSLAIGFALAEGRIASLDDLAERYAPKLRGTVYGQTTIRNLLRMASGARYEQRYDGKGDPARFAAAIARDGIEGAAKIVTERATEQGTRFYYASPQSTMLGAVVRGATGESLSAWLEPRLWQAIGAEQSAIWITDRTGLEVALGNFNATLRDYARLGTVLAYDGARPDVPGRQVIPRDYLLDATDWKRQPPAFQPGKADRYWGYGYQFWLLSGEARRFAMLGVYGQSIFVYPALHLAIIQVGANATPEAGDTSLARERSAFWYGVQRYYGK